MKKLCILILSFIVTAPALAQTRTVTNADLEKYRQKRVESERQLREKYAEMGFPSPEQLEKQNAEERAELDKLSDQLRNRRLQEEMIAQTKALRSEVASLNAQMNYLYNQGGYSGQGIIYPSGYPFYGYAPFGFYRGGRVLRQISNLPPNMRTVQEYASMYPNWRPTFNRPTGGVRFFGGGKFGGIRIGGSRGRIR